MEASNFQALGFSIYEIKVYLSLIKNGKSRASDITKDTGISSGKVYETLEVLEKRGLISSDTKGINQYVAKPIKYLKKLIDEKNRELLYLKTQLEELKFDEKKSKDEDNILIDKEEILVVRGEDNFGQLIKQLPTGEKFDYKIKYNIGTDNIDLESLNNQIERGIDCKVLVSKDQKKEDLKKLKEVIDYKFFDTKGIEIDITDYGVLISLQKEDYTLYIKSEEFSNVMKQLFDGFYKERERKYE